MRELGHEETSSRPFLACAEGVDSGGGPHPAGRPLPLRQEVDRDRRVAARTVPFLSLPHPRPPSCLLLSLARSFVTLDTLSHRSADVVRSRWRGKLSPSPQRSHVK